MNELIIIKTTVKNKVTKNNIVSELIKNDYVSCINVIENVSSHYKWQGKVESEKEDILFIKTMKRNEKLVYEIIRVMHDYEIPEIITIGIKNIDKIYLLSHQINFITFCIGLIFFYKLNKFLN